jgi:hypothetical protein
MKEQRFDIHQHITNQIVAAIEAERGGRVGSSSLRSGPVFFGSRRTN